MAESKSSEKLTLAEIEDAITDTFALRQYDGAVPPKVARFAAWLIDSGLPVAPETTPEPVNMHEYRVVDSFGVTWKPSRPYSDVWERVGDGFIAPWSDIPQPITLFRKVDTPEPAPAETSDELWKQGRMGEASIAAHQESLAAPKYVATRAGACLAVDGFYMAGERVVLEAEIGRRQAALDLLTREEQANG